MTGAAGITVTAVINQAPEIQNSVSEMTRDAVIGGILAVLMILVFLRSFRGTLVSGISIPLSLLVAFILMNVESPSTSSPWAPLGGDRASDRRRHRRARNIIGSSIRAMREARRSSRAPPRWSLPSPPARSPLSPSSSRSPSSAARWPGVRRIRPHRDLRPARQPDRRCDRGPGAGDHPAETVTPQGR